MFDFIYNDLSGVYTVSGPDGEDTVVTLDEAYRAMNVQQGETWAYYTYYPDGRIERVTRSNGTITEYGYNFQNLVMTIDHYDYYGALMLGLEYTFNTNGLVVDITESDQSGLLAVTTFEHDARRRLTEERRNGTQPYDAFYSYDDGGNRTSDYFYPDGVGFGNPEVRTLYAYSGNRLLSYGRTYPTSVEHGEYAYDGNGNIWAIGRWVTPEGQDEWYFETEFEYDEMGRVWRVLDYEQAPGGSYERVAAREFRYGGGRQRYLVRELDPATLEPVVGGDTWSDYNGDWIYADYQVDQGGTVTELARYLPGEWRTDVQDVPTTAFFHTNVLGTTRTMTADNGLAIPDASRLYTAFGHAVTPPVSPMTRYG